MQTLHIITNPNESLAQQVIERGGDATVVLIQDAVNLRLDGRNVYASAEDVRARGLQTRYRLVAPEEIIDLVVAHDKVICWH